MSLFHKEDNASCSRSLLRDRPRDRQQIPESGQRMLTKILPTVSNLVETIRGICKRFSEADGRAAGPEAESSLRPAPHRARWQPLGSSPGYPNYAPRSDRRPVAAMNEPSAYTIVEASTDGNYCPT